MYIFLNTRTTANDKGLLRQKIRKLQTMTSAQGVREQREARKQIPRAFSSRISYA